MSKNQTLATVTALAGDKESSLVAAFSDLQKAIFMLVKSGTRNALEDTRADLQCMKGKRAASVLACVESAYAAANVEFAQCPRGNPDAEAISVAIALDARCEFEATEAAAKDARTVKAAATKAAAERAKKDAERALKTAAKSIEPLARALTLADALEMLHAACVAGDEQARNGVLACVALFADINVAETV